MRLKDISRKYRLSFIHNPKHFYSNSFKITKEGPHTLVIARPRKGEKPFRKVAVVKNERR